MKLFIATIALLISGTTFAHTVEKYSLPAEAFTAEENATSGWITLNGVCYRAQDTATANKTCRTNLETINLMSNDKMVITGACEEWSPKCTSGYQALLTTRALVVPTAQ